MYDVTVLVTSNSQRPGHKIATGDILSVDCAASLMDRVARSEPNAFAYGVQPTAELHSTLILVCLADRMMQDMALGADRRVIYCSVVRLVYRLA